jgi:hypothetical protein
MQLASLIAAGALAYVVIVLYRAANGERPTRRARCLLVSALW